MARLLIRSGHSHELKASQGRQTFQPGDVIAAKHDGWVWGRIEMASPLFLCVDVPGLNPEEVDEGTRLDIKKLKLGICTAEGIYATTKPRVLRAIVRPA
jgi:hypothetical protein